MAASASQQARAGERNRTRSVAPSRPCLVAPAEKLGGRWPHTGLEVLSVRTVVARRSARRGSRRSPQRNSARNNRALLPSPKPATHRNPKENSLKPPAAARARTPALAAASQPRRHPPQLAMESACHNAH
eukprot:365357-Chlamydomonas_euryale.AAC.13